VPIIDSSWRNRYIGSDWLFRTLSKAKFGYGLFKDNEIVAWVFNNEVGALTHLFTLEDYRRKGYAEILMKLFCNVWLKEDSHMFAYCRQGNTSASKLFTKLGFEKCHDVRWCFVKQKP
jgi:predicted GNAT family acetyltransferase